MTAIKKGWMSSSLALATIISIAVVIPQASADVKKTLDDAFAAIAGLQSQIDGINAANGNQQSQLDSLQTDVNILKGAVQVESSSGEVTINSADNIMLQPGTGKMVKTMGDSEVMGNNLVQGEATLEGNVEMMDDATIMGASMLEGELTAMSDATIEGFLSVPPQETGLDGTTLSVTGSSATIETDGLDIAIEKIIPVISPETPDPLGLLDGTELTLRLKPLPGDEILIDDCAFGTFGDGCDAPNIRNIDLNIPGGGLFAANVLRIQEDTTLKLRFNSQSFIWEEVSRTEASIYTAGPYESDPASPVSVLTVIATCSAGDFAIGGNVEDENTSPSGTFTVTDSKSVGADYIVEITNGSQNNFFLVTVTCVHMN